MKKSRGTEKEIEINDKVNICFGSVDKNDPKSVYIKFSSWCNTIDYNDDNDYKRIIKNITKRIKNYIYEHVDKDIFYNTMVIVDMDMRESGISSNKPSFMSCEITLYQKNNYKLIEDELVNEMNRLSESICDKIFNKDKFFEFHKHKRGAISEVKKSLIN